MVFAEQNSQDALKLAQHLCQVMNNTFIKIDNSTNVSVTLSIGVASRSIEINDIDDILKNADEALYIAKSAGRNKALSAHN